MPITDYYLVLGVSREASTVEVREKFRQLAREGHPDRFTGEEKSRAESDFQLLTQAANVLLDPEKRRGHDMELFRPETHKRQEEAQLATMLIQRGRLALQSGNYFEAVENLDRATQEEPGNALAWYHLAQACSHNRRWLSRGVSAIATAVKLEPTNAEYLLLAGGLCAKANMTTRAERYYKTAQSWGADEDEVEAALTRLSSPTKKQGDFR